MKDAYSFDADQEGLDVSYDRMVQAYDNIFKRCGHSYSVHTNAREISSYGKEFYFW